MAALPGKNIFLFVRILMVSAARGSKLKGEVRSLGQTDLPCSHLLHITLHPSFSVPGPLALSWRMGTTAPASCSKQPFCVCLACSVHPVCWRRALLASSTCLISRGTSGRLGRGGVWPAPGRQTPCLTCIPIFSGSPLIPSLSWLGGSFPEWASGSCPYRPAPSLSSASSTTVTAAATWLPGPADRSGQRGAFLRASSPRCPPAPGSLTVPRGQSLPWEEGPGSSFQPMSSKLPGEWGWASSLVIWRSLRNPGDAVHPHNCRTWTSNQGEDAQEAPPTQAILLGGPQESWLRTGHCHTCGSALGSGAWNLRDMSKGKWDRGQGSQEEGTQTSALWEEACGHVARKRGIRSLQSPLSWL